MKLRYSISMILLLCVHGNQGVQKSYFSAANSGENSFANNYNVMHDFNFPDVTYPTSLLDTCQPFYFNSNSNGLDAIVGPFSSDVKSNYMSLLSCDNGNKVKDEVSLDKFKCELKDDIVTWPLKHEENVDSKIKSEDKLENVRKSLRTFLQKNYIDPELEEILSLLYNDEIIDSDINIFSDSNTNNEIEPKFNVEEIESDFEDIILQPLIESRVYLDSSNSSMEEKEDESVNSHEDNKFKADNSTIEENVYNAVINDDLGEDLRNKNILDVKILEPIIDDIDNDATHSELKSNSSEIKLDSESINGDMCSLKNSENDSVEMKIDNIKEDIYCHSDKSNEDEQISDKYGNPNITNEDEHLSNPNNTDNNNNSNNSNADSIVTQPIASNVTIHNNEQKINESIHDENNHLIKLSDPEESNNEPETTNKDECTMTIPKEAVVFDVVSKDGLNLEKPLLDIVPSNIPVRLKINIELCKPDSIEKDDITEIADDFQTLSHIENNIDSLDLNNRVEHIDENESAPQEEIIVLDEINDSDFISALSILLLDSLNNKPIEIIPPEINVECKKLVEFPIKCKDDENVPVIEEKLPTVPDIYVNGESNGHISSGEVKFTHSSPLIDTFIPININHKIQVEVDTDNTSEAPQRIYYKADVQKNQEPGKPETLMPYPLVYYPYNPAVLTPKLVEQNAFYDPRNFNLRK